MKYIKLYTSPTTFDILYQDENETKFVADGLQSPKVIEWLKTHEFEVIPFTYDLVEMKIQYIENFRNLANTELVKTDYKVIRQSEQTHAKKTPKMSEQEFISLSNERQVIRDKFNTLETQVNACQTYEELILIKW